MGRETEKSLEEMTLEELWQLFPIQLEEHNPEWALWYEEELCRLVSLLGSHIARIDHIGSTPVVGLTAKPIVDILLQTSSDTGVDKVKATLISDGWLVMAEQLELGELDLNKGYTVQGFAEKVYHLHVRREGDWDEIRFRDFLMGHPDAASQYAELKKRLFLMYEHNRDAYTAAKGDFVRSCVAKARSAVL